MKTTIIVLVTSAFVAAILTAGVAAYSSHIANAPQGAAMTPLSTICAFLLVIPGGFLAMVFMTGSATWILVYGGAFLDLFAIIVIVVLLARRFLSHPPTPKDGNW